MAVITPVISTSLEHAVIVTTGSFGANMTPASGQISTSFWQFVSTTACWIRQDSSANLAVAGATAGPGSMFVPANVVVILDGLDGADLAVIRDTADGKASLTKIRIY